MTVLEKVKTIILDKTRCNDNDITANSVLREVGIDSLDSLEMVMELEDQFNIQIPDADARGFEKVDDIVKYISDKIK